MKAGDDASRATDAIASNAVDLLAYFERRAPKDDAADLLAETMMTAWRRFQDLPRDETEARMWLFGIARNTLANAERTERRRWRLANRLRLLLEPAETGSAEDGSDVRDAVARLDPELGELVRLVHWDGFSIAESAKILGLTASTARSRYQRAKAELRSTLTPTVANG